MGLPMWRAPSPEAADSPKPDPSASARSPIRRQTPARRRPGHPSYNRPARNWDAEQSRDNVPSRAARALNAVDTFIDGPAPGSSLPTQQTDRWSSTQLISESRVRDRPTTFQTQHWRERERRVRLGATRRSSTYNFADLLREEAQAPSLTPNFAPARGTEPDSRTSEPLREWSSADFGHRGIQSLSPHSYTPVPPVPRGNETRQQLQPRSPEYLDIDGPLEDPERGATPVAFPPLRRMTRRAIADGPLPSSSLRESWSPTSEVDGLGDRERSFSPDPQWETMLTTIQPDDTLPSASSSFASAAASRSFSASHASSRSSSNSASSSRTHLTVPSAGAPDASDLCNDSAVSGSDTEEEVLMSAQRLTRRPQPEFTGAITALIAERVGHVQRQRRGVMRVVRPDPSRSPRRTHRSLDDMERRERSRSRAGSVSREQFRQAAEDLEEMRAVLERLTRRDDIPDEVWVSAGLTRSMAQGVSRVENILRERAERLDRSLERL